MARTVPYFAHIVFLIYLQDPVNTVGLGARVLEICIFTPLHTGVPCGTQPGNLTQRMTRYRELRGLRYHQPGGEVNGSRSRHRLKDGPPTTDLPTADRILFALTLAPGNPSALARPRLWQGWSHILHTLLCLYTYKTL